jgi:CHASE3 domain sensor protein
MTIQKKLYLAFGGSVLVSLVATALALWAMQRMSAAIVDLSQRTEDILTTQPRSTPSPPTCRPSSGARS